MYSLSLALSFFVGVSLLSRVEAKIGSKNVKSPPATVASVCHVSNVFGDHMVLQRDKPAKVYGFANPGVLVTVSLNGVSVPAVTADNNGVWRTSLPPQPATTTPSTLSFSCSDGTIPSNIVDVLFGDVHICSGQSNMQFTPLSNAGVPNITDELAAANLYPLIRTFTVGEGTSSTTPLMELKTILQNWSVASNTSIGGPGWSYTSAVCWFTYRNVFNELGGKVPQGIIGNNWGGTPIQHWSSPDALKVCNGGVDSTLWNAMIVPYVTGPMTVRTAIWYQGESNVGQASYYDCQFTAMISDWRAKLPSLSTFGFVQIAAYTGYGNAPGGDLRQAQLSPLTNLPRIAFATAIDLVYPYSAPGDIHPIAKQLISKRLSDSLLATEYSIVNTGPSISPFYSGATTKTNGVSISVSVTLTGCVDGCSATTPYFVPPGVTDAQAAGFQIQTNDAAKTWWNATATMSSDGNSIILSVTAPTTGLAAIASAYGRATWPVVTHYNSIGLPVIPWCFTIEGISCYSANNTEYSGPNAPRFQEPPRE